MSKLTEDLSKNGMISWINQLLKIQLQNIQQLGTGAVFCQLLDAAFPGKVPLGKVNWKAKLENQNLANLKILISTMQNLKVDKHIDIQKIAKMKFQDNFELLSWFRKFVPSTNSELDAYMPYERRDAVPEFPVFRDKIKPQPTKFNAKIKDASKIETKVMKNPSNLQVTRHTNKSIQPVPRLNKTIKPALPSVFHQNKKIAFPREPTEEEKKLQDIYKVQKNQLLTPIQKIQQIRKIVEKNSSFNIKKQHNQQVQYVQLKQQEHFSEPVDSHRQHSIINCLNKQPNGNSSLKIQHFGGKQFQGNEREIGSENNMNKGLPQNDQRSSGYNLHGSQFIPFVPPAPRSSDFLKPPVGYTLSNNISSAEKNLVMQNNNLLMKSTHRLDSNGPSNPYNNYKELNITKVDPKTNLQTTTHIIIEKSIQDPLLKFNNLKINDFNRSTQLSENNLNNANTNTSNSKNEDIKNLSGFKKQDISATKINGQQIKSIPDTYVSSSKAGGVSYPFNKSPLKRAELGSNQRKQ